MRIPHMLLTALILFFATSGYALPQKDKLPAPIRNIRVTVLLDQILIYEKGRGELESEIRKIFENASSVFEKEFSVTFSIDALTPWQAPYDTNESLDPHVVISETAKTGKKNKSDITIAILQAYMSIPVEYEIETLDGRKFIIENAEWYSGYANAEKNVAAIVLHERSSVSLIHEIAHIFYAGHTESHSIMNESLIITDEPLDFDEENRQIILENRLRSFDKSLIP